MFNYLKSGYKKIVNVIAILCSKIIFKISRIKKNRIVFTSFDGHYSDNPKYIFEKIYEINKDIEMIWLLKPEFAKNLPSYIKWYDIDSYKAKMLRGSAAVLVDNVYCGLEYTMRVDTFFSRLKKHIFSFLNDKKGQFCVTTFHGTPLKKMGRDQIGNVVIDFICPNTTMILGNEYSINIYRYLTFNKLPIIALGSPRNDILFHKNLKPVMKLKLGLPNDKNILLFAPTFRNDGVDVADKNIYRSGLNQLEEIDFDKLFLALNKKFGGEWVFICRFHYHVEKMVDWEKLNTMYPGKFINGNKFDDMAEYLACSDLLLTDSSSSMFDFMLTKRPCMLYFPDYENYLNKERGFYISIANLPFPLAITFEELIENIENFDMCNYKRNVDKLIDDFGYVDDKYSSERIAKFILNRVNNES